MLTKTFITGLFLITFSIRTFAQKPSNALIRVEMNEPTTGNNLNTWGRSADTHQMIQAEDEQTTINTGNYRISISKKLLNLNDNLGGLMITFCVKEFKKVKDFTFM